MGHVVEIRITPDLLNNEDRIKLICAKELNLEPEDIVKIKILKRLRPLFFCEINKPQIK